VKYVKKKQFNITKYNKPIRTKASCHRAKTHVTLLFNINADWESVTFWTWEFEARGVRKVTTWITVLWQPSALLFPMLVLPIIVKQI